MQYHGRKFLIGKAIELYRLRYDKESVAKKLVEDLDVSLSVGENIAEQACPKKITIKGARRRK